jgi:hypothetical protein
VRGRQSTMYRAQRMAEHTIYDHDPTLFDRELDRYLQVTAQEIRDVTARYLSVENRVVLDIVPAAGDESPAPLAPEAQLADDATQPGAPTPQIPQAPDQPKQLSELPAPNEPGSEPVHP